MRPVFHGDVVAAARAIYPLASHERSRKLQDLLFKTARANAFRLSTGRAHPMWGDGSLMTAALADNPPPEPNLDNRDYCSCLAQVFEALVTR